MSYIQAKCPCCGETMEISQDKEIFFCQYCGNKMIKDIEKIELSGNVSLDNMANAESLLERAFIFIEDQNYTKANEYLEKVLDIKPKCAKAYLGKVMCQIPVNKTEDLSNLPYSLLAYDEYKKALSFSSGEEHQKYIDLNTENAIRHNENKKALQNEIDALTEKMNSINQYVEENKDKYNNYLVKKANYIKLIIAFSIISFIALDGLIVNSAYWLFLLVPSLCILGYAIYSQVKLSNLNQSYQKALDDYYNLKTKLKTLENKISIFNKI